MLDRAAGHRRVAVELSGRTEHHLRPVHDLGDQHVEDPLDRALGLHRPADRAADAGEERRPLRAEPEPGLGSGRAGRDQKIGRLAAEN